MYFFNFFFPSPYRADGGVSNNSFVMQMTSDLINKKIEKPANADMSSLGAAFLAGLASGMYTFKGFWFFPFIMHVCKYRGEKKKQNKKTNRQNQGITSNNCKNFPKDYFSHFCGNPR